MLPNKTQNSYVNFLKTLKTLNESEVNYGCFRKKLRLMRFKVFLLTHQFVGAFFIYRKAFGDT